jgi:hypothetical protein
MGLFMNVVFLSPHFPSQYFRFCLNLKAAGANVLGVGDEPFDNLSQDVRSALTEYYQVDDMHNYDALVRACGLFTHRYGKIDRLDSLNEYWLGTEARLRDDFNIFGVRGSEIDFIRRKSCMKAKFRKAGVPVARGQVVQSVPGVFSSALGDIGYIFRSKSLDEILEIVRFIHQTEDTPG